MQIRVVALDLRGFHRSDKPVGVQNYKLDTLVAELKAFIEFLGMQMKKERVLNSFSFIQSSVNFY